MSRPDLPDKTAVLTALRARIDDDLAAATASQLESQAGATHEEARPEGDKDTRATEASYLARGLAKRVEELSAAASALAALRPRAFDDTSPIALSALVLTEDDDGRAACYFLAPAGGGIKLTIDGIDVTVVTPQAPVGRALLGKHAGDDVDLRTAAGPRTFTIHAVR